MTTRILIAEPKGFDAHALSRLSTVGDVVLRQCSPSDVTAALSEFDVFWFRLAHRIDDRALGMAPRCRMLVTPVTGLDHIDLQACSRKGVRVISLRGEVEFLKEVRATAELTLGLALALLRHIPAACNSVAAGQWDRDRFAGRELYRKTAGIVGVGRLGSIVAGYFRALGMEVLGYDIRDDFPDSVTRVSSLDELMSRADLVSLHVSYDRTTHHLIDVHQLKCMRTGAVLINTARGGVVDEAALLDALVRGDLSGAALDVLQGEHDIAGHSLIEYAKTHSNLLIVPHLGGNTVESFAKTERFLAERVVAALQEPSIE